MSRLSWQNISVLCLGLSIAAVGAFLTESGTILRHGAAIAVAVFFTVKGTSRLQCKSSDVLLAFVALCFVVLSKTVPPGKITPVIFEVGTLAVLAIYPFTGLTYKAIIVNQRSHRGS
jgi:hypothetical protein